MIPTIMATTIKIPTPIPALKISPASWQDVSVADISTSNMAAAVIDGFIRMSFWVKPVSSGYYKGHS